MKNIFLVIIVLIISAISGCVGNDNFVQTTGTGKTATIIVEQWQVGTDGLQNFTLTKTMRPNSTDVRFYRTTNLGFTKRNFIDYTENISSNSVNFTQNLLQNDIVEIRYEQN